jgi:hypothetical protein
MYIIIIFENISFVGEDLGEYDLPHFVSKTVVGFIIAGFDDMQRFVIDADHSF